MEENKYNNLIHAEAKLNEGDLDEEYNIPNEILKRFNTKKFFLLKYSCKFAIKIQLYRVLIKDTICCK